MPKIHRVFLIVFLLILFLVFKYNDLYHNRNIEIKGTIIYSFYNKVYQSLLGLKGKKVILDLPKDDSIRLLDSNQTDNSLLLSNFNGKRDEILLYKDSKLNKVSVNNKDSFYTSFANFASNNEIYYSEEYNNGVNFVLKKLNIDTKKVDLISEISHINRIQYSEKSNLFLISIFNINSKNNFDDIYLLNPISKLKVKLAEGSSPIWYKDGESFLYYGKDKDIYEYNVIQNKKTKKVKQYLAYSEMILSPNKNYIIQKHYKFETFYPNCIITSLENGKSREFNTYDLYGISEIDLKDIIWVK